MAVCFTNACKAFDHAGLLIWRSGNLKTAAISNRPLGPSMYYSFYRAAAQKVVIGLGIPAISENQLGRAP
jgi:hypothetical protein